MLRSHFYKSASFPSLVLILAAAAVLFGIQTEARNINPIQEKDTLDTTTTRSGNTVRTKEGFEFVKESNIVVAVRKKGSSGGVIGRYECGCGGSGTTTTQSTTNRCYVTFSSNSVTCNTNNCSGGCKFSASAGAQ